MNAIRRIATVLIPVSFIFLLTTFALQAEEKTGLQQDSITVQSRERTFEYYVPRSYSGEEQVPLLFSFHGRGSTAKNQMKLTKFDTLAEKEGFIVVFPNSTEISEPNLKHGHERQWNDGRFDTPAFRAGIDDVQFISKVIDYFSNHYNIDLTRVYVTGMSNGAFFANRLGVELSERIAGIGAVAGTLAVPIAAQKPRQPVPTVLIMGTEDPVVPYEGVQGYSLSAEDTVGFWKKANDLDHKPDITKQVDENGIEITKLTYSNPTDDTEVIFYKIDGGGHTWPGGPQYAKISKIGKTAKRMNATEVIWNELKKHTKENLSIRKP